MYTDNIVLKRIEQTPYKANASSKELALALLLANPTFAEKHQLIPDVNIALHALDEKVALIEGDVFVSNGKSLKTSYGLVVDFRVEPALLKFDSFLLELSESIQLSFGLPNPTTVKNLPDWLNKHISVQWNNPSPVDKVAALGSLFRFSSQGDKQQIKLLLKAMRLIEEMTLIRVESLLFDSIIDPMEKIIYKREILESALEVLLIAGCGQNLFSRLQYADIELKNIIKPLKQDNHLVYFLKNVSCFTPEAWWCELA